VSKPVKTSLAALAEAGFILLAGALFFVIGSLVLHVVELEETYSAAGKGKMIFGAWVMRVIGLGLFFRGCLARP
jgi:hypothetical protein